jgi:hypothetical protein
MITVSHNLFSVLRPLPQAKPVTIQRISSNLKVSNDPINQYLKISILQKGIKNNKAWVH